MFFGEFGRFVNDEKGDVFRKPHANVFLPYVFEGTSGAAHDKAEIFVFLSQVCPSGYKCSRFSKTCVVYKREPVLFFERVESKLDAIGLVLVKLEWCFRKGVLFVELNAFIHNLGSYLKGGLRDVLGRIAQVFLRLKKDHQKTP